MPNTIETGELDGIRFLDAFGDAADPAWRVDAVSIVSLGPPPPPPVPDKVVEIAGVYPHLADRASFVVSSPQFGARF